MISALSEITYVTLDPAKEYSVAIDSAESLAALRRTTKAWRSLADEAYEIAMKMGASDFREFREGLALERKPSARRARHPSHGAGEEWAHKYGAIVVPAPMLFVSLIANQYFVPWGLAFKRCVDAGSITTQNGIAVYVTPEKTEETP